MLRNRGAALAFVSLLFVVGVGSLYSWIAPRNEYYSTYDHRPAAAPKPESIQDISAETVAHYTEVLAWFTGILAAVSIFQGFVLYRSDKSVRRSADAAFENAESAKLQAEATSRQTDAAMDAEGAHLYPFIVKTNIQRCFGLLNTETRPDDDRLQTP